jgi:phosphoribosylanthranilate isomerase
VSTYSIATRHAKDTESPDILRRVYSEASVFLQFSDVEWRMRVKICGVRTLDEAEGVIEAGADALGFHIELEHSRCPVAAATAGAIISALPPFISSVVVTSETDPKNLLRIMKSTGATTLQLHKEVSPETVRAMKTASSNTKMYVAIWVTSDESIAIAKSFEGSADTVILDTMNKETGARGGTGKTHDWNISKKIVRSTSLPVILAGGLNPGNVAEAIKAVRPYAVDVNSGVSNPDGTKDFSKVKAFVERAKSA